MVNYAESGDEDDEDEFKSFIAKPTRATGRPSKRRKTVIDDDDFSQASEADIFHEGKKLSPTPQISPGLGLPLRKMQMILLYLMSRKKKLFHIGRGSDLRNL